MMADDGPLAHLRVLDFSWVWSGPLVTAILAEFGAQVIKIEHGARLDSSRLRGRPVRDGRPMAGPSIEIGPYYHQTNHDKLSITLNLKAPAARDLVDRLVGIADIVVENLSPGALERVGLGYARAAALNPRLIYLSMAAAGQTGPLAGMRAYAPIMSSYCGIESLIGYPGEAPIGMMNFGYGDPNAAVHALIPLLAAIHEREASGRGRHIDMSQLEAMLAVFAEPLIDHAMNGRAARATGNGSPSMAPHGIYPAAGDDAWVSIAVADDAQWQALVACMGAPAWAQEPHLVTAAGRVRAAAALDATLAAWTRTQPAPALAAALRAAGIACSPVQDIAAQWADPQFEARGIRQATTHRLTGAERLYRTPWTMARHPPRIRASAPLLGEHNAQVFCDLLGMAPGEVAQLQADGVIA
ncbi:MAG: CoA transferase [Burkholderiales bacterium]|nr:CoA transferase [Burkholderiales bacterium]